MQPLKKYEFWFITGSQFLYGEETLRTVEENSRKIADYLNETLPASVLYKGVMKTSSEITKTIREANYDESCLGIITFCHTFSPSKMWINGLDLLQKPYLHLHTQFNRKIPDKDIDMDYMNLHQSAHGDREHGFIGTRLRCNRKIVAGYWQDKDVCLKISNWIRACIGVKISRGLKVMRFGDNMREVAVTEGDKVEAQLKLGWEVNTWGVGDLVNEMNRVDEAEIDALVCEYREKYDFATDDLETVRYQAKEERAIERMLNAHGCAAYTNTFEDLHGLKQLPGLASQNLMAKGYGYGGEGDWKVAAMTAVMKAMTEGMGGGTAFMEDYTYDLTDGNELSLGAHMLEVCPTLAAGRPRIEVHKLGIGGKESPARLVFEGKQGKAITASLVDMGGRLRLIVQDIDCVEPIYKMPNLPVARVMWKPLPDLKTGAEAWILAGGAHHTVLSYDATAEMMRDFARIMDIEFVHISCGLDINKFEQELILSDMIWNLKRI